MRYNSNDFSQENSFGAFEASYLLDMCMAFEPNKL